MRRGSRARCPICAPRWFLVAIIVSLIVNCLPPVAGQVGAAAPFSLNLSAVGDGTVSASPPGPVYPTVTNVTLTPTPGAGSAFIGWTIDNAPQGWAAPKTITMDADHTVVATFAPVIAFSDLPAGGPYREAILELSARGVIKGYSPGECEARGLAHPCFGLTDEVVRAQMAALIVRAFGWDNVNPSGPAPFVDLGGIDPELQRAIAILAEKGIINGYGNGLFGPVDNVLHIQVISFVTRSMVQAGYWVAETQDNPAIYPNVPLDSGHRLDLLTFVKNAGPIPDRPQNQNWADWNTPSSRAWTVWIIWQVLDSFFGQDTIPSPGPSGSPSPSPSPGTSPSPSASPSPSPSQIPGNVAPVAGDDNYNAVEDTPLNQAAPGVLANDTDADGPSALAVGGVVGCADATAPFACTTVNGGTLTLNANGSFAYTPALNFNGSDSFSYTATDGNLPSNAATAIIAVSAQNDAPVNSVPAAQNTVANTALVFSAANGNAITIADVDAGANPVQVTLTATNGTLTLPSTAGLSFTTGTGTNDPTMTFTGTIAAINAALNGLSFNPTPAYTGGASVQIVTNDQGNSGAGGALSDTDTISIAVTAGAATTIAIESGNGGTETVGATRTLQAKVTDATNTPVPNYNVAWAIATGNGSFGGASSTTSMTDASGIASITWTVGTTAGAQSVTATAPPVGTPLTGSPLTFALTATPGPAHAASSTITANPTTIPADGTSMSSITVQLKDQFGNNLGGSGGTVALSKTGGGTLSGVTDNTDGTYSATLTAPTTAGAATVSGTLNGSPLGNSATVTYGAGAATKYLVTAGASTATAGTTVTITAQLADTNDNPVATSGLTVTWTSANGGSFSPGTTSMTNASGIATIDFIVSTTAGVTHTVTATDTNGATGTSGNITTQAGTATKLGFIVQPSNTVAGSTITPAIQVAIQDTHGNTVTTATDTVALAIGTNPGGGTLSGTASLAAVAGVATFSGLSIDKAGTGYTLVATSGILTSATSNLFNITAGTLAKFKVEAAGGGNIGTQSAGTPFNIMITAQDAFDNVATSFNGTATLTTTPAGGITAGGTTGAFTNGVLTSHSVTIGTGGTYTITATNGGATGTSNSFIVTSPPTAVDDGPAANSAPGDAYHGFFNATLNVPATGILANDNLGSPAATLTSFQVGATTYTTFGVPQSVAGGHTLTVNTDGSLTFVPATGFVGTFMFDYTIANTAPSTATVTLAVGARPVAGNSTYGTNLLGNVPINTATSTNTKVNAQGDGLTYNVGAQTGGTATIATDGTFTFAPAPGFEGAASFNYTVQNGFGTSGTGTVSLTVANVIWFVKAGAPAGGNGTFTSPFNCLVGAGCFDPVAADGQDDRIFLYTGAYTGGLTLLNGQRLVGEGASGATFGTIMGVAWPADSGTEQTVGGTAPTIGTTIASTNAVTLGQNNILRGFDFANATGVALIGTSFGTLDISQAGFNTTGRALSLTTGTLTGGIAGITSTGGTTNILLSAVNSSSAIAFGGGTLSGATGTAIDVVGGTVGFTYIGGVSQENSAALLSVSGGHATGTITFNTGTLSATAGTGLQFDNADGTYNFNGPTTLNGDDAGIDVQNGSGGTFSFAAGSAITNPTNQAIRVVSSTASFTYSGAFTKTNNANVGILVQNNTGGTIAFNGSGVTKSLGTSGANAVNLLSNGGATIDFTGGGLAITTSTGVGFNATGGGTVTVQGAGNTLTSAGGAALNVANTTIGGGGLTFQSISANGGTSGIVLNTTGSSGGLTVPGTGAANSGGTIQSTSGAGISLTSTLSPSFANMLIQNTTGSGIQGTLVTNFSFTNGTITNTGTVAGTNSANIAFNAAALGTENNLSGTVTITGNTLTNAAYHGVDIFNHNGTIASANISSNTITSTNSTATSKGSGIRLVAFGSASTVASVTAATLNGNSITNFPSGAGIVAMGGNANSAAAPAGTFGTAGHATNIIAITGNAIRGDSPANPMATNAILATVSGVGQGNFNIANNGTAAARLTNIGGNVIVNNATGPATITSTISNNFIDGTDTAGVGGALGISVGAGGVFGANDPSNVTVTITNNNVTGTDGNGILAAARDSNGTLIAKIQNNTVAAPLGGTRAGIQVNSGTSGDNTTVCLNISGNTTAGSGVHPGIGIRKEGTVANVNTFGINGLSPSPATGAQAAAFVAGLNPGSTGGALSNSGNNYVSCSLP